MSLHRGAEGFSSPRRRRPTRSAVCTSSCNCTFFARKVHEVGAELIGSTLRPRLAGGCRGGGYDLGLWRVTVTQAGLRGKLCDVCTTGWAYVY